VEVAVAGVEEIKTRRPALAAMFRKAEGELGKK
jgi:hypothetical protein